MKTSVLINISRLDEIVESLFMCDDLPEKVAVALLNHILEISHLRVSKFNVYYTLIWPELDVACLIETYLLLFHLSRVPANARPNESTIEE